MSAFSLSAAFASWRCTATWTMQTAHVDVIRCSWNVRGLD
jgi:hypothetical protein